MTTIKGVIGKNNFKTVLYSSTRMQLADEPVESGGTDAGFSPSELIASALATCTCVTLRMFADRKGWKVEDITTYVDFDRDRETHESFFKRRIMIAGLVSVAQKQQLLQVANGCFIHNVLTHQITVNSELIDGEGGDLSPGFSK